MKREKERYIERDRKKEKVLDRWIERGREIIKR
jgi:hypothetical protein